MTRIRGPLDHAHPRTRTLVPFLCKSTNMEPLVSTSVRMEDRRAAGFALARKLVSSNYNKPLVVAIPHGGVEVGAAIATTLRVHLDIMPCRKISNPSDKSQTIGSVSKNEVMLHNCPYSVPQDFLFFKTAQLRHEIDSELRSYYGDLSPDSVRGRTVILADDLLKSRDTMIACLRDLRKQQPDRIVVAVPFVEAEAARIIQAEADEIVFLKMQSSIKSPLEFYSEFEVVTEDQVKYLLAANRESDWLLEVESIAQHYMDRP